MPAVHPPVGLLVVAFVASNTPIVATLGIPPIPNAMNPFSPFMNVN
jgi:hypothetical protein